MSKVEKYFETHAVSLNSMFEQIRKIYTDSGKKGYENERIFAEFIESVYPCNFVTTRSQIIDSKDHISDEVDVCINNQFQPFKAKPGQPLIAEGIDLAVQIKGTITTKEIQRIVDNCISVKRLDRDVSKEELTAQRKMNINWEDAPYHLFRIPYVVFAFTSQLKIETIQNKLSQEYLTLPAALQLDALFVMNRGTILNFREGKGFAWQNTKGEKRTGLYAMNTQDRTLLEFMRHIYEVIPVFYRLRHPIVHYFKYGNLPYGFD